MPQKLKPTGRQKSMLMLHFVIFVIGAAAMWFLYDPQHGHGEWRYPWPAWTTAAWALLLLGHICIVFTSYEDKGEMAYRRQAGKA